MLFGRRINNSFAFKQFRLICRDFTGKEGSS